MQKQEKARPTEERRHVRKAQMHEAKWTAAKTHTYLFVSKARKEVDNGCYSSLDHTRLRVIHSNFSQQLLHLESRKRRVRHRFSNRRLISHKTLMTTTSLHCRKRTKWSI
jgi:hypothetical protein